MLFLRPAKKKALFLLAVSLAIASVGIAMIRAGEGFVAGLTTAFFGLCAIVFVVQLVPAASYLHLSPDGFVVRSLFRTSPLIPWKDVGEFRVWTVTPNRMVVYDYSGAPHPRLKRLNRAVCGADAGLPDTYGMKAYELANLMNDWRARYGGDGQKDNFIAN